MPGAEDEHSFTLNCPSPVAASSFLSFLMTQAAWKDAKRITPPVLALTYKSFLINVAHIFPFIRSISSLRLGKFFLVH